MAETLKNYNLPFKKIFGIILPQLKEISRQYPKDSELSIELWKQEDCRESRLLAILLVPQENIQKEKLFKYIKGIKTQEEADILSFTVLRNLPENYELYLELSALDDQPQNKLFDYMMLMFKRNLDQL